MKKILLTLSMILLSAQVMAWSPSHNQPKATSTSSATSSANQQQSQQQYANSNAQGGDAYAKGGTGVGVAGALSGSNSGGNSQDTNINVEGDEAAASSAIAGMASECVTVLAAQATGGGFSLGGIDGDCRAAIASDRNLELYMLFKDADPEAAAGYLELAKEYAALANPSAFKIYMSGIRQTTTDIVLSFGWLALFAL